MTPVRKPYIDSLPNQAASLENWLRAVPGRGAQIKFERVNDPSYNTWVVSLWQKDVGYTTGAEPQRKQGLSKAIYNALLAAREWGME